ncbi:MAG: hypothetical protein QE271_01135 [Bacteriovoracaceae bacterium]|nr:hypothetical protein [Bacteriovoracaceae bacterium]
MIFTINLDIKTQESINRWNVHTIHSQASQNILLTEIENAGKYRPILILLNIKTTDDLALLSFDVWKKVSPYFYLCLSDQKFLTLSLESQIKKQDRCLGLILLKNESDKMDTCQILFSDLNLQCIFNGYCLLELYHKLRDSYISKFNEVERDVGHMIKNLEDQLYRARAQKSQNENKRKIVQGPISFHYRYGVGYESGSEYSEFVVNGSDVWWLNFSTNSYASSAVFLRYLDKIKKIIQEDSNKNLDVEEVTELLQMDLTKVANQKDKKHENHYFISKISPSKKIMNISKSGLYQLISAQPQGQGQEQELRPSDEKMIEDFIEEKTTEHYTLLSHRISFLQRHILVSPGYFDNILNQSKRNFVIDFVKENLDKFKHELIDEMMLFLDKRGGQEFYNYDTSLVYLEIRPHGIQAAK